MLKFTLFIGLLTFFLNDLNAQESQKLIFCTQNLFNFGLPEDVKLRDKKKTVGFLRNQEKHLIARFIEAKCDLIAIQEILSQHDRNTDYVLKKIARHIFVKTNKKFLYNTGKSNDIAKLGYLFDASIFKMNFASSYANYILPKLNDFERNRYFQRGPLRIDLEVIKTGRKFSIFNFHFKSASSFSYDPAKYKFELDRMQMAAGLNEIIQNTKAEIPDTIILMLGDRNSKPKTASAKILYGEYLFEHFSNNYCQITKELTPYCDKNLKKSPNFISLINPDNDYLVNYYNKIDDIIIDKRKVFGANAPIQNFKASEIEPDKKASDHPLLWVELEF